MAVEWFTDDGSGIAVNLDEGLVIVGLEVPDWVRSPPETPEIGARVFAVRGSSWKWCPKCETEPVRELELEDRWRVGHCGRCGFVWYRLRE